MAKKKIDEKASEFERMLMWTSYRYCIGRHTYVVTMADDIARHYYNRLDDAEKMSTARDIRRELETQLRHSLPFDFEIENYRLEPMTNPIKTLMMFFEREGVKSIKELYNYSYVHYDARENEFDVRKCESKPIQILQPYDIEDLIPWERLASCFDTMNHCLVTAKDGQQIRAFYSWARNVVPAEEKGYWRSADFGWHDVLVPLDEFLKGRSNVTINEDLITEIDNDYYGRF